MATPAAVLSVLVQANSAEATAKIAGFQKELERVNATARKGVEARLGGTFNPAAFAEYERATDKAIAKARDRAAFKAELGANFSPAGFRAYQRELAKSAAAAKGLEETSVGLGKRMSTVGQSVSSLGGKLSRNVTVPIVALGAASAKMAMDFQASMERIHTQAGVPQKSIEQLSKAVLSMAGSVGQAPNVLADGMYHVASSLDRTLPKAKRMSTELKVLRIAAEGATVGHANLVDVTNALDAAVVSGIKGIQNFSQGMGALNAVVGAGDMTMQDLAEALGTGLLGPMKNFGVSLKDVGGALAVFGDNNIRGADAATKLNAAVRIMAAPSKAASKALGEVGLSTLQLANDMRTGGIVKAIADLKQHLEDSGKSASQQGLVLTRAFGGRQSTGVQLLVGQLDRLREKTDQVGKGAKNFGQDWAATQQTAAFKTAKALDTMKADLTRFGGDVLPPLLNVGGQIVNDVDKVAKAFSSLPPGMQHAIITGGLVVAAIGPAMKVAGLFTSGIGKLYEAANLVAHITTGGAVGLSKRMVATEEVGTLIAKTMIGGGGAGLPGGGPPGTGAGSAAERDANEVRKISRTGKVIAMIQHAGNLVPVVGTAVVGGIAAGKALSGTTFGGSTGINPMNILRPVFGNGLGATQAGSARYAQGGGGDPYAQMGKSAKQAAADFSLANAQLAKLEQHQQGIHATAFNLQYLAIQAKKAGDVKWQFADTLGAQLLKGKSVASAGIQQLISQMDRLAPGARGAASRAMTQMSQTLENMGKVPKGTTVQLVDSMLSNYNSLKDRGGQAFHGLMQSASSEMNRLHNIAKSTSGKTRQDALDEMDKLRDGVNSAFNRMTSNVSKKMSQLKGAIQKGSSQAAQQAGQNMSDFEKSVRTAMNSGILSASDGANKIGRALNAELKAFGTKPIPLAVLKATETKHMPVFVGGGHGGNFNQGGMVQFGQAGQAGHDNIPVNFGGVPIMVGAGEQGYVFTRHQQAMANAMMAPIGGLPGLFSKVSTPNYMASGGAVNLSGHPGNITGSLRGLIGTMESHFPGLVVTATTDGSHVPGSYHYKGEAVDMAASPQYMLNAANWIKSSGLYRSLMEGIHNPNLSVHAGQMVDPSFYSAVWAGHANHIHMAITGALGAVAGALQQIVAPKVEGGGTPGRLAQTALNKLAKAANSKLNKTMMAVAGQGGSLGAGGGAFLGGQYNLGSLERLWTSQGGSPGMAHLMAAIALAESGGNPNAHNPSGASGLWQILGSVVPGNLFNPVVNARNAIAKLRSQGLGAWVTYTSGAYRQYMDRGGMVPYAGKFHQGGVVPGPPGKEQMALVRGGEVISASRGLNSVHGHPPMLNSTLNDFFPRALAALALIPSQGIGAQITGAQIANSITLAQNAGNVPAQQKALNNQLAFDRKWLAQDKAKLRKVNAALRRRGLSAKQRGALLQDKLALTQEIGTLEGDIGSTTSTLQGLTPTAGTDPNQPLIDAMNAQAAAMKALQASLDQNTHYMASVAGVETRQAIKALSDVISGQIGGNFMSRATGSAGDGSVARYGAAARA